MSVLSCVVAASSSCVDSLPTTGWHLISFQCIGHARRPRACIRAWLREYVREAASHLRLGSTGTPVVYYHVSCNTAVRYRLYTVSRVHTRFGLPRGTNCLSDSDTPAAELHRRLRPSVSEVFVHKTRVVRFGGWRLAWNYRRTNNTTLRSYSVLVYENAPVVFICVQYPVL